MQLNVKLVKKIRMRDVHLTEEQLEKFKASIFVRVKNKELNPTAVGGTIVDISTKQFINDAKESKDPSITDTTKAIVKKSSVSTKGRNYQFTASASSTRNFGGSLGLNAGVLMYGGINAGVNAGFSKTKETSQTEGSSDENSLGFEYTQEETICVPPKTTVDVTITTHLVNYEQQYTLELSVPKSGTIFVSYVNSCCCGLISGTRTVNVSYKEMVCTLPDFRDDQEKAYFTQDGKLTWVGERCEVHKKEKRSDAL